MSYVSIMFIILLHMCLNNLQWNVHVHFFSIWIGTSRPPCGQRPLPYNQSVMLNHVAMVTMNGQSRHIFCISHIFVNRDTWNVNSSYFLCYRFNCKNKATLNSSIGGVGFTIIILPCHWDDPWWSHGCDEFFRVHSSRAETLIFNNEWRKTRFCLGNGWTCRAPQCRRASSQMCSLQREVWATTGTPV